MLDNNENNGAGLIIHVNDFMAQKLQDNLHKDGTEFIHFKSPYAPDK